MNKFLLTRKEIDDCTASIRSQGLVEHNLSCKNWDVANIMPHIGDGNILDMGCMDSYILQNAAKAGRNGLKHGIDLGYKPGAITPVAGVEFFTGDLMKCPFEDGRYQYVTCLSVIEHQVDFDKFAAECSRLLSSGGKLFVTFDYWTPKQPMPERELYGHNWMILDRNDVDGLIAACFRKNLKLDRPIDWTIQDQVINEKYCAPFKGIGYTFGILMFIRA